MRTLLRNTNERPEVPEVDLETIKLSENFRTNFVGGLKNLGAIVLPYPVVRHEAVVGRDLLRRKPFNKEGKGYRDTLIWESALAWADDNRAGPPIVLVSNNKKDFGDPLHSDLVVEMKGRGFGDGLITRIPTLEILLEQKLKPQLRALNDVADQLKRRAFPQFDLLKWVATKAVPGLDRATFSPNAAGITNESDAASAHLKSVLQIDEIEDCDVRRLSDGSLLISTTARATGAFTVRYVYEPLEPESPMDIIAAPESYQETIDRYVAMDLTLIIEERSWEVDSASLDEVRAIPVNPHD